MKSYYDVIVVGAGPAGSWAAKYAAEQGVSVLLLEKDRDIGIPVRCAEGISERGLKDLVPIQKCWIAQIIKGARFVAPNGLIVDSYSDERGYILHRKLFDFDLAKYAVNAGVHVQTKAYVNRLFFENGIPTGVKVNYLKKDYKISASIIIGADGMESRVGRWAGLSTALNKEQIIPCAQMNLAGLNIDSELVQFYLGNQIAPGGYIWIFPKGKGIANVGLGIAGMEAAKKKPIDYLSEFVKKTFPEASILTIVAGSVSSVPPFKHIVTDRLMLVGDAARQGNPLTGGGIINGMVAGKIAGRIAGEALRAGDLSKKRLMQYQKEWHKIEGKNCERSFRIKKAVDNFSDEQFDDFAEILLKIPKSKRTAVKIFQTVLVNNPKLILDVIKIFT